MASWIRESDTFQKSDERPTATRRAADGLGLLCLVVTLLMLSTGVRIARADDANMSVDPKLAAEIAAAEAERPRVVAPRSGGPAAQPGMQPGVPAIEIAPGVIRLNTRGYNYLSAAGGVDVPSARPPEPTPAPTVPAAPAAAPTAD